MNFLYNFVTPNFILFHYEHWINNKGFMIKKNNEDVRDFCNRDEFETQVSCKYKILVKFEELLSHVMTSSLLSLYCKKTRERIEEWKIKWWFLPSLLLRWNSWFIEIYIIYQYLYCIHLNCIFINIYEQHTTRYINTNNYLQIFLIGFWFKLYFRILCFKLLLLLLLFCVVLNLKLRTDNDNVS